MKKVTVALALAAFATAVQAASHRHFAGAGETIVIGYGAAAQDPGYTGTKFSAFYDVHEGGTVKYDMSKGNSTVWNQFVVTNGMATLDFTGWPESITPPLCAGIFTDGGKGWVRVKGVKTLHLGSSTTGSLGESGPTDVQRIEFVDANDQPVAGKILYGTVNLKAVVTNNVWAALDSHWHCLMGEQVLEGDYAYPGMQLIVGNEKALSDDQTVTIVNEKEKGALLRFLPGQMMCNESMTSTSTVHPFYYTRILEGAFKASFNVNLQNGASVLFGETNCSIEFGGNVSGSGSVSIAAGRTGDVLSGSIRVPLRVNEGSTVTLADGANVARFESVNDDAVLAVGEGAVTVGEAVGRFAVVGQGKGVSSVNFIALGVCTIVDDGSATILFNGQAALPFGCTVTERDGVRFISSLPVDADGVRDASSLPAIRSPYEAYDALGSGAAYANLPKDARLRVKEGVSIDIVPGEGRETASLAVEGGVVTVRPRTDWRDDVSLWFDFSRKETLRRIGEGTTEEHMTKNFIERCVDWRDADAPYSLWNRRCYQENGSFEFVSTVMPVPKWDAYDGKTYISLDNAGSSRRLPLSVGTGYNTFATLPAEMVVMVFGAQNGGGYAAVGTTGGAFGRTGTSVSDPITTNDTHDVWLDGRKVDPTTQTFIDGWQVVSIKLDGVGFRGLGFLENLNGARGGQNYAEVLVFTNAVSDLTRCEAEAYLAAKWGISTFSDAALKAAREAAKEANATAFDASGDGTITASGCLTCTLGGNFKGTVNLSGARLKIKDVPMPFTAETLPKADCVGWYDPDYLPTLRRMQELDMGTVGTPEDLRVVFNRNNPEPKDGDSILIGIGRRMPRVTPRALGFAEPRNWVDFDGTGDDGNTLRIAKYDSTVNYRNLNSVTLNPESVGTGFMVLDSRRSAFTPVMSTIEGRAGGDICSRTNSAPTGPIWDPRSSGIVRNGETRLNGRVVNQQEGFTRCPEVLAFRPQSPATTAFFGYYIDTEFIETRDKGLLMGEVLLYSSKLSDLDTQRTEAYLMDKWCGLMPDTCVNVTGATVTGNGEIEVDDIAKLPKVDPAFTGSITAEAGNLDVVIDPATDAVAGALVVPNAALSLPSSCTITVRLASRPRFDGVDRRVWTVFEGETVGAVDWDLRFEGTVLPPRVAFVRDGKAIRVVAEKRGLTIILR